MRNKELISKRTNSNKVFLLLIKRLQMSNQRFLKGDFKLNQQLNELGRVDFNNIVSCV